MNTVFPLLSQPCLQDNLILTFSSPFLLFTLQVLDNTHFKFFLLSFVDSWFLFNFQNDSKWCSFERESRVFTFSLMVWHCYFKFQTIVISSLDDAKHEIIFINSIHDLIFSIRIARKVFVQTKSKTFFASLALNKIWTRFLNIKVPQERRFNPDIPLSVLISLLINVYTYRICINMSDDRFSSGSVSKRSKVRKRSSVIYITRLLG